MGVYADVLLWCVPTVKGIRKISSVQVTDDAIIAHLGDGRVISVPLSWSWRLSAASRKQRRHYELIGDGQGVHWPDVDEDISLEGMLRGIPAKRPSRANKQTAGILVSPKRKP